MSLARSEYRALPFECPACGRAVDAPAKEQALLDERGWAHVPCACGKVNVIPYEPVTPEVIKPKRRPSWHFAALWILIIALIALLIPVVSREPVAEPEPPSYLTT
jgi:hypothetical protein